MPIKLCDYKRHTRKTVQLFGSNRLDAKQKQQTAGTLDQDERAGVTTGKNMDGFVDLLLAIIRANGLADAEFHRERATLTLPGFFRPTKLWDILVIHRGELVAALELKSHAGPSFGNNFNNRAEEAIGTAHDFWTAYREGTFGKQTPPFVGWLMLVEDAAASRSPVSEKSPHFPVFNDFKGTSYLQRYELLCQKLISEKLYTAAALLTSSRANAKRGCFAALSQITSLEMFLTLLAGHAAATAARHKIT